MPVMHSLYREAGVVTVDDSVCSRCGECAAICPGEVLSLAPLVVATGDGALELTKTEWRGAPAPALQIGQAL